MQPIMLYKEYCQNHTISNLLKSPGSRLCGLLAHSERLTQTEHLIKKALPTLCREHCQLVSYRNGTLSLQADSAAWATRLRYQQRDIISQLSSSRDFSGIKRIKISIRPRLGKIKIHHHARPISKASSTHLNETAAQMGDSSIAKALRHLAANK